MNVLCMMSRLVSAIILLTYLLTSPTSFATTQRLIVDCSDILLISNNHASIVSLGTHTGTLFIISCQLKRFTQFVFFRIKRRMCTTTDDIINFTKILMLINMKREFQAKSNNQIFYCLNAWSQDAYSCMSSYSIVASQMYVMSEQTVTNSSTTQWIEGFSM